MGAVTLRLSEPELKAFKEYAELYGETLSGIIRQTMREKVEDEFDYRIAEKSYKEWEKDGHNSISLKELNKELGF